MNVFTLEAWTLPLATTQKITNIPYITGSFSEAINQGGRGSFTVRKDWERLTDIVDPANNKASLIRVLQDGVVVGSFFARRTARELVADSEGIVTVTGPGIGDVVNYARVENYDYPTQPTVDPDWVWGGEDAPINGFNNGSFQESYVGGERFGDVATGFEDGTAQNWEAIPADGTFNAPDQFPTVDSADSQSGTFSLLFNPGQGPSGIRRPVKVYGDSLYEFRIYIKSAVVGRRYTFQVEDVNEDSNMFHTNAYKADGRVVAEIGNAAQGAGAATGGWDLTILHVRFGDFVNSEDNVGWVNLEVVYQNAVSGPDTRIDSLTLTGQGIGLSPWVAKDVANVSSMTQTATPGATTPKDGSVAVAVATTGANAGIKQRILDLTPGRTYTFTAYVHHTTGSPQDFTVRIRRASGGGVIASTTSSVPSGGGWTKLEVTALVDVEIVWVDILKATAGTFYADDTSFYLGFGAGTWGTILKALLDDAAVDHTGETGRFARSTLGFLNYTSFTTALDSAGVPWDGTVEYRAKRGKKYARILADGELFGYEWRVRDTGTGFFLDAFNPYDWITRTGGLGIDRTGTGVPTLRYGPGVVGGPLVESPGTINRLHVEGERGLWDVKTDTAAATAYDTRESYEGDRNILGEGTILQVANQVIEETVTPVTALKVDLDPLDNPDAVTPYKHLQLGDTYPIDLAGDFTGTKRVVAITTDFSTGYGRYTVEFDAPSFTSDPLKGVTEAVRLLLEKFDELADLADQSTNEEIIVPPAITAAGGAIPTVLVAASNARASLKAAADFVCDGVQDDEEINLAFAACPVGGRVHLTEGDFYLRYNQVKTSNQGATPLYDPYGPDIVGVGAATRIHPDSTAFTTTGGIATSRHGTVGYLILLDTPFSSVRDLTIVGNPKGASTASSAIFITSYDCTVKGVGWGGDYLSTGVPFNHLIMVKNFATIQDIHVAGLAGAEDPIRVVTVDGTAYVQASNLFVWQLGDGGTNRHIIDTDSHISLDGLMVKYGFTDLIRINGGAHVMASNVRVNELDAFSTAAVSMGATGASHLNMVNWFIDVSGTPATEPLIDFAHALTLVMDNVHAAAYQIKVGLAGQISNVRISPTCSLGNIFLTGDRDGHVSGWLGNALTAGTGNGVSLIGCTNTRVSDTRFGTGGGQFANFISVDAGCTGCVIVHNDGRGAFTGSLLSNAGTGTVTTLSGNLP